MKKMSDEIMKNDRACDELVYILTQLFPKKGIYPLHEPTLGSQEAEHLLQCLQTGYVSYLGPTVKEFEAKLQDHYQVQHAITVQSGTAALRMILMALGIGNDQEVLCPALTFVASANAICHAGAIPHFVDCEADSFGIDPVALRRYLQEISANRCSSAGRSITDHSITDRRITALMPVHVLGHPCQMEALSEIAQEFNLILIEDAAESLGTKHNDKQVGTTGIACSVSFNGNKIITTGGGGAILTNDSNLAQKIRHLISTAKKPHPWKFIHDQVAFNERMPSLNAALGLAQMSQLEDFVSKKRALASLYEQAFSKAEYWEFVKEPINAQSNYWLNAVRLKAGAPRENFLDGILETLHSLGFYARPFWTPLHLLPMFSDCPRSSMIVTEMVAQQIICLPSSPKMLSHL